MEKQFLEKLTEILDTPVELNLEMSLEGLEEWDSLGMVSFVAMADVEFGKKIIFNDLKKAVTVNDLYLIVKSEDK
jgi:acyl carrier protein